MTPSEARKDPRFQKWELEANKAQEKVNEVMTKIKHHFPLTNGGYWDLRSNGKLVVAYPESNYY